MIKINRNFITLDNIDKLWSDIGNQIASNQNILKLLYYNDEDALTKDDLYLNQIRDIVGKGEDKKLQRIFKTPFNDDIVDELKSELRFYIPLLQPDNLYLAGVAFNFEIIVHNSLWELTEGRLRPVRILQELLQQFNNYDIKSIGNLTLKDRIANYTFGKKFTGFILTLSTRAV